MQHGVAWQARSISDDILARMDVEVCLPRNVYEALKVETTLGTATDLLDVFRRSGPDAVAHPGDYYGRVLAWMWYSDREEAVRWIAELLSQLHGQHPLVSAGTLPPWPGTLEDLLAGIHLALPDAFRDTEFTELERQTHQYVPA